MRMSKCPHAGFLKSKPSSCRIRAGLNSSGSSRMIRSPCVGRGKKTGIIGQVRLNSEYLWGCDGDLGLALTKVHLFLCSLYGEHILLDQSTLDLAVDVLGLDLSAQEIKEQFISRAVLDDENPSILGGGDGFID